MAYMDNTGLYRKYGTERTAVNTAGEYKTFGEYRTIEVSLDLATVTSATAGAIIVSDTTFIPKDCRIAQVEVYTETAAVGSGAVLNLGMVAVDRTTEIDFDGFLAALPTTSMDVAGETNTFSLAATTFAGDLIGTTTSATGYICADYDTAAFTAGRIHIRIRYYNP